MAFDKGINLLLKIGGDAGGAVKAVQDVKGSVDSLSGSLKTGDIGGFTNGLKNMVANLGATQAACIGAIAGVAAIGTAAIATTKYLFNLANEAAEFGSKIYDASVQTGMSAETLSALKVAADQSGVEFEKITQSVYKFSLQAAKAAEGNKTAAGELAKLGLTAEDVSGSIEGSFAKAVAAIAAAENPIKKAELAAAAFGTRGGKEMLKLVDQVGGNIPELVRKMKELGVTIDDNAAKAADDFQDSLVLLDAQFNGIKRTIGNELMPVFLTAMEDMSKWFAENKAGVKDFARGVADATGTMLKGLMSLFNWVMEHQTLFLVLLGAVTGGAMGGPWGAAIGALFGAGVGMGLEATGSSEMDKARNLARQTPFGYSPELDRQTARAAAEMAGLPLNATMEESLKAMPPGMRADFEARQRELVQLQREANKKKDAFTPPPDVGVVKSGSEGGKDKTGDEAKKRAEQLRKDQLETLRLAFDALKTDYEKLAEEFETDLGPIFDGINQIVLVPTNENIDFVVNEFNKKTAEFFARVKANLEAERDKELAAEDLSEQAKLNIKEKYRQKIVQLEADKEKALKEIGQKGLTAKREIFEREMKDALAQRDAEDRLEIQRIENSKNFEFIKTERIKAIKLERLRFELELLGKLSELEKVDLKKHDDYVKRLEELKLSIAELENKPSAKPKSDPMNKVKGGGFWENLDLGTSSMVVQVEDATGKVSEKLQPVKAMADMLGKSFQQMAQGLGNFVQQWVLTGEVGPKAMRKLTASILAGLAAQASVEALMELARGFKELALGNPVSAANHFTAAAIFGSVAGVAAVAGRAIAGDSFKNEANRATGSVAGSRATGGQGQAFSSQDNQTINATQSGVSLMPTAEIVIRDASGMFSQLFEAEIRNNSRVRRLIIDTANS